MEDVFIIECGIIRHGDKIAGIDLDHTIIKPTNGKIFPKNYADWILISGAENTIKKLYADNYKIVIFTNQAGKNFDLKKFTDKVNAIFEKIDVPSQIFCCTTYSRYRKPCTGMWDLLCENNGGITINKNESFYVGDMESDHKFALNLGIKYYYSLSFPLTLPLTLPVPLHPFKKYPIESNEEYMHLNTPTMLILVGPPASTKSTFSENNKYFYSIVSQDVLKTYSNVIKKTVELLKKKKNIIIDRQNKTIEERAVFINLAKEYGYNDIYIVFFDFPREICEHLAIYRRIKTGKYIPGLVFNIYYKDLETPTTVETTIIKQHFTQKINDDLINNFLI